MVAKVYENDGPTAHPPLECHHALPIADREELPPLSAGVYANAVFQQKLLG
jgi:hypothetical protein